MLISHIQDKGIYHLKGQSASYVLKVMPQGHLAHLHWGKALKDEDLDYLTSHFDREYRDDSSQKDYTSKRDELPFEYPTYGQSDFRPPALELRNADGSSIVDLRFKNSRILPGKPGLEGLPAIYTESDDEAETLEIILKDSLTSIEVTLIYTVFRNSNAISRSSKITNHGKEPVQLEAALSLGMDIQQSGFEIISLSGSWGRERRLDRHRLQAGSFQVDSTRGESSHQQSPFLALTEPGCSETTGSVYGFSLVYSGNFLARAEVDSFSTTRVLMGINPFDFSWHLEPGEAFQTPEAVMVYSCNGLGEMSLQYHRLYRSRLAKGLWRDKERPVLVNNWEATYFDFDAAKILEIARAGRQAGAELFVLDDGWFGHRDSDNSSLGDWFVYREKLPEGLKALAEGVNKEGLQFGLWFEPEMISPDSELYREHPDWCIHVKGRERTEIRNQLVLDITRQEVREHVLEKLIAIMEDAPISYIKWDMNRPLTEMGSAALPPERQRELAHRYCLSMYKMMDILTSRFPEVLFESCSGGGARFDAGVMHYMPQAWTSDNMDPYERLRIQWSTSLVFPASMMGAHVCSSPNHSTDRRTALATRAAVAMSGAFGYEVDLSSFSPEEMKEVALQVAFFKEIRSLVQFGDFYRLRSPYETSDGSWMYVSPDKKEAFVMYCKVTNLPNPPVSTLKLSGLNPNLRYRIREGFSQGLTSEKGKDLVLGGELLQNAGLTVPRLHGQLLTVVWRLIAEA